LCSVRRPLTAGAGCYLLFVVSNLYPTYYTTFPAAILLGFGASILWTGQGTYLTTVANADAAARALSPAAMLGLFNGVFFGIFQCSQVLGNVLSSLVLSSGSESGSRSEDILWGVYSASAAAGILLMCVLTPHRPEESVRPTVVQLLTSTARLLAEPRMLLIVPLLLYSGVEQGFWSSDFTASIIKPVLGRDWIGWIMAVYGGTNALTSFSMGLLVDKQPRSRYPLVLFALGLQLAVLASLLYLDRTDRLANLSRGLFFAIAAVWGVGDGILTTMPGILLGDYFRERQQAAFSNQRLWLSAAVATAFFLGLNTSLATRLIIYLGTLVAAVLATVGLLVYRPPTSGFLPLNSDPA
jgi:MFS family permease